MADEVEAEKIRESNRKAQTKIQEDPIRAQEKRENDIKLKEKRMADEEKAEKIRESDRKAQAKIHEDPIRAIKKRERDRLHKSQKNTNESIAIKKFELEIKEGPTLVCVCCGGLFFKRSVKIFNEEEYANKIFMSKILFVKNQCNKFNSYMICNTCDTYARGNKKVPRLALSNGLDFNAIDKSLENLNELEERLCSPRIPFLKIRPLGWDKQKGNFYFFQQIFFLNKQ